jgi:hypothetical protein
VEQPLTARAVELARTVVGAPYLGDGFTWGGKGWDPTPIPGAFVISERIKTGYEFWNNKLKKNDFGEGLDCSGLVFWSYNKAFGATRYQDELTPNPVHYENANGQCSGSNSSPVSEADLQAGDLLCFDHNRDGRMDHVALYIGGNGESDVVHASQPGDLVKFASKTQLARIEQQRGGVLTFRRLTPPIVDFAARGASPIDLIVTDPDGFTISRETFIQTDEEYLREIPGVLYYSDAQSGADGKPSPLVFSPLLKIGDYTIEVIPRSDAAPTDLYDLRVRLHETTVVLADNVPVTEVPSHGYGVEFGGAGVVHLFSPVSIDIKPGDPVNAVNLRSSGSTPVAILSDNAVDAREIDPRSVIVAGAPVKRLPNGKPLASLEDVNGDLVKDLVVHIVTKLMQLRKTDVNAYLVGHTVDGESIKGSDSVVILP